MRIARFPVTGDERRVRDARMLEEAGSSELIRWRSEVLCLEVAQRIACALQTNTKLQEIMLEFLRVGEKTGRALAEGL
jgi:hypothetical protein